MKVFLILLIAAEAAFGAVKRGNGVGGGVAVRCGDNYRLLDYYEMEVVPPIRKLELGTAKGAMNKVLYVLDRLSRFDALRSHLLYEAARVFDSKESSVDFVGIEFGLTPDTGAIPDLGNCRLRQVIIQKKPVIPGEKLYVMDFTAWDKLSEDDQAGLILHESIYNLALKMGQKDATNVRRYTALISSEAMNQISKEEYDRLARTLLEPPKSVAFNTKEIEIIATRNHFSSLLMTDYLVNPNLGNLKWTFFSWSVFEKVPSWVRLDATTGILQISPEGASLGENYLNLVVYAGEESAVVPVKIIVVKEGAIPPVWAAKSFTATSSNAHVGKEFGFWLAPYIVNASVGDVRFKVLMGPSWLKPCKMFFYEDSAVCGTPPKGSEGLNEFAIVADIDGMLSIASFYVLVEP